MKSRFQIPLTVLALLILGGGLFFLRSQPGASHENGGNPAIQKEISPAIIKSPLEAGPERNPEQAKRQSAVAALKSRWVSFASEYGHTTPEQEALAAETARLLLCSDDAIELLDSLDKEELGIFANVINRAIGELLASPEGGAARESLLDSLKNSTHKGDSRFEEWSMMAGKGCPDDQFDDFLAAIDDKRCAQSLVFGRNMVLVKRDPLGAIRSTLDQYNSKVSSLYNHDALKMVMAELPEWADYEAIDQILPKDDHGAFSKIRDGRLALFSQWAKNDPAGAVNYIIDEPKRAGSGLIGEVVRTVTNADISMGAEWVTQFPPGPYYDEAATAAVSVLTSRNPFKAEELQKSIQDPKWQKKAWEYLIGNTGTDAR